MKKQERRRLNKRKTQKITLMEKEENLKYFKIKKGLFDDEKDWKVDWKLVN